MTGAGQPREVPAAEHPHVPHAIRLRQQHRARTVPGLAGTVRRADDTALASLSRVFGWPATVWLFLTVPLLARFAGQGFQAQFFYYSSGWVQLFALPLLTWIGVRLQRSSDAQSDAQHQALTYVAAGGDDLKTLLAANTDLTREVRDLTREVHRLAVRQQIGATGHGEETR